MMEYDDLTAATLYGNDSAGSNTFTALVYRHYVMNTVNCYEHTDPVCNCKR